MKGAFKNLTVHEATFRQKMITLCDAEGRILGTELSEPVIIHSTTHEFTQKLPRKKQQLRSSGDTSDPDFKPPRGWMKQLEGERLFFVFMLHLWFPNGSVS